MPIAKYYCDYCDKQFVDTPVARRKHFESKTHQTQVKMHYDSFKDPTELLIEESKKPPCTTFQRTGSCNFGTQCRFSHLSPAMMQNAISASASLASTNLSEDKQSSFPSWTTPVHDLAEPLVQDQAQTPVLISHVELPPSLLPPPPGGYSFLAPPAEWG
eukprot:TRINITY_DN9288_c0_g1_i2.p1 TRINITY_DN9288_c0_g1~~TRINITY_DN9288_c0_g1_i2.p1  ORF type:complete len:159 (-),score=36.19 TRINITY_DN9288_c0_g1_i2:77-553(-)